MKKLLFKTALFVVPFFIIYLLTLKFYSSDKGDIVRLGYNADTYNYDFREVFKNEFKHKINFTLFSEINLKTQNNYNVFTIGDSFSEQGKVSYQNYLSDNSGIKVLHLDRFLLENPIETVNGFLNGNVLDSLKVDYIILQSVEREFVERALNLRQNVKINNDSLSELIKDHKKKSINDDKKKSKDKFFSKETLKFTLNFINYNFDDNAFSSKTYKVKTNKNLFSNNNNNILFFLNNDLEIIDKNNNIDNIKKLNEELNILSRKLKKRGIKLIVLPCPDKLDYYYDEIVNKNDYPKPMFFDYFRNQTKEYIYIDSKKILQENSKNIKDMYFFDDTHWSPLAAKMISKRLKEVIQSK